MAGRCRRTASTSVSTATRPIPATVSSMMPGWGGTGGVSLCVSNIACRSSNWRWLTDAPVGTSPAQDWRPANVALRYRNSPPSAARKHTTAGIARRLVAAPTTATTMTAPTPPQNHIPPCSSG